MFLPFMTSGRNLECFAGIFVLAKRLGRIIITDLILLTSIHIFNS